MKNNDKGWNEVLDLLKRNPELMKELVFDSEKVKGLLKNKVARRLLSKRTKEFLDYVAGPKDGYPIVQCQGGTQAVAAKGTGQCLGGTVSVWAQCRSGTQSWTKV